MKQMKDDYRILADLNYDYEPEHGGVMVTVFVERRASLVKFENGDVYDGAVWLEVFAILAEVQDETDQEELQAVMEYNYPDAFH